MKSQGDISFFRTIGILVSVTIIFASSIAYGLNDNISLIYSWPRMADGQEQEQEQQDNSIDGDDATTNNNSSELSLPDLFSKVEKSVVQVASKENTGISLGSRLGSGFVYDRNGHIVTNYHVAGSTSEGKVQITFLDGSTHNARLIGGDPFSDLAVLQLDGENDGDIYIDIYIVNEINDEIKQVKSSPTTCTPQQSTVELGPGSIAAKGVKVLATFDPCILTGGGAVLNLPDSNNNLKLVAVDLEGDKMHKAVEVNLQKVNTITDDQTFYNAQFAKTITGVSPVTDKVDTIQEINSLVLLNDSPRSINFVNDNSISLNAVLSSN